MAAHYVILQNTYLNTPTNIPRFFTFVFFTASWWSYAFIPGCPQSISQTIKQPTYTKLDYKTAQLKACAYSTVKVIAWTWKGNIFLSCILSLNKHKETAMIGMRAG